jgi:hypothetical protein
LLQLTFFLLTLFYFYFTYSHLRYRERVDTDFLSSLFPLSYPYFGVVGILIRCVFLELGEVEEEFGLWTGPDRGAYKITRVYVCRIQKLERRFDERCICPLPSLVGSGQDEDVYLAYWRFPVLSCLFVLHTLRCHDFKYSVDIVPLKNYCGDLNKT